MEIEKRKVNTSMIPELSVICVSLGVLMLGTWFYVLDCCGEWYGGWRLVAFTIAGVILGSISVGGILQYGWDLVIPVLFPICSIFTCSIALIPGNYLIALSLLSGIGRAIMNLPDTLTLIAFSIALLIAATSLTYQFFYEDKLEIPQKMLRILSLLLSVSATSHAFAVVWWQLQ